MAMFDFFSRLRARRSVLMRTRPRPELPAEILYLEWLPGASSRKVLDTSGKEHVLTDQIMQSNYRVAGGGESEKLIADHWSREIAQPQAPVRHEEAPATKPAVATKPAQRPAVKVAAKHPAKKKPAAKAPAKKAARRAK